MTLFDIAYDDFKREDTTNNITITLYTDDKQPITPDSSHTWKAKVSKGDRYVGEYPVTISGNAIKLSSSNLTRLPNGDYGLELWETYGGSTTIYPSAGVMEFRVHRNANDTLGTVDPTTDINSIIDDLHKAGQNIKVVATNTLPAGSKASVTQSITNGENQLTFNIPQGDTNATATNALNVANSVNSRITAIQANGGGRNLAYGTSNDWTTVPDSDRWNTGTLCTYINAQAGDVFTVSVDTQSTKPLKYQIWQGSSQYVRSKYVTGGDHEAIASGTTHSHTTFTWPSGATQYIIVQLINNSSDGSHDSYKYRNVMFEKGTVAHDWQSAPEDTNSAINSITEQLKGYSNTGDMQNYVNTTIQKTADDINTKVSGVESKVNNLSTSNRNLARGTSDSWTNFSDFDNKTNYYNFPGKIYLDGLQVGDVITVGITLKNTGITAGTLTLQGSGDVTGWNNGCFVGKALGEIAKVVPNGATRTIMFTNTMTAENLKNSCFAPQIRTDNVPKGGTLSYKCFFVKKGNIPTSWSPAPEDIQTQLDALKEAVKKLGGTI